MDLVDAGSWEKNLNISGTPIGVKALGEVLPIAFKEDPLTSVCLSKQIDLVWKIQIEDITPVLLEADSMIDLINA